MYKYFAYGLKIASEIELEELINRDFKDDADIQIKLGECPEQITGPDWHGGWWQANDEYLLCDFTDIIRALVSRNGKAITVQVFTEDDFQLRSFIYGQVLSACLLLRDYFLLHGACVKIGDKAVGFCGPSGVGKSTLAWGFMNQGNTVYSDDLIALKIQDEKLMVYPGFPRLRITKEVLDVAGDYFEDISHYPGKYNYLGEFNFDIEPIALEELLILMPKDIETVMLVAIDGWSTLVLLEETRYSIELEELIFLDDCMLQRQTKLANLIKSYYLLRPINEFCLKEMVQFLKKSYN